MTLLLMKSRNADLGTPPFSARTVISARFCVTTPSMRLWQSFTSRACSPSPTYVTCRPRSSRSGTTSAYESSGPEQTRESMPALTTFPLPLTGAAMNLTPRSASRWRVDAEASEDTVEQSTTCRGARSGSASSRSSTWSRSSDVETIVNTTSRSARSDGSSTTVAPNSVNGSALARVRFHAATSTPPRLSRWARAKPIRPVPIHPTRRSMGVINRTSFVVERYSRLHPVVRGGRRLVRGGRCSAEVQACDLRILEQLGATGDEPDDAGLEDRAHV